MSKCVNGGRHRLVTRGVKGVKKDKIVKCARIGCGFSIPRAELNRRTPKDSADAALKNDPMYRVENPYDELVAIHVWVTPEAHKHLMARKLKTRRPIRELASEAIEAYFSAEVPT